MDSSLGQLMVPLRELRPYPRNARRGDVEAIKQSLVCNGQYRPVVVNRRSMEVLAGNQTLLAASELGWDELSVSFVDADEELARRIVLVDNRTSDLAGYDEAALAELLSESPELEGTGYDEAALSRLLDEVMPVELPGVDEQVPGPPRRPASRRGDLYRLGAHRLLCGDATSAADYRRLLRGERPELLWTDPPFGVCYVGKMDRKLRIEGDRSSGLAALLGAAFGCADEALAAGAALYVAHPAGPGGLTFGSCLRRRAGSYARRWCGSRTRSFWGARTITTATSRSSMDLGPTVAGSGAAGGAGMAATPSTACSRWPGRAPRASTRR